MIRQSGPRSITVASVVVIAAMAAGVGVASQASVPLSPAFSLPIDGPPVERLSTIGATTLVSIQTRLLSGTAPVRAFLDHPTKLLLLFELGLLVEHLRLLNRLGVTVPAQNTTAHGPDAGDAEEELNA